MGLFKFTSNRFNPQKFTPDLNISEYDNWLNFLQKGGTSEQWEQLKSNKQWNFKKDNADIFMKYQKELKPISDKYYSLLKKIQKGWSTLYTNGDFNGEFAESFKKNCLEDIRLYEKMRKIDEKYNEKSPENIPAFKRLSMLYEKQGNYEEAVAVCKKAYVYGMDERERMLRMIKKAGRKPTKEEFDIINEHNLI